MIKNSNGWFQRPKQCDLLAKDRQNNTAQQENFGNVPKDRVYNTDYRQLHRDITLVTVLSWLVYACQPCLFTPTVQARLQSGEGRNFKMMLFQFIIFLLLLIMGHALNGYIYYEDAFCSGEEFIEGTLIYTYGDEAYHSSLDGFTVEKYDGPCKYFHGGFFDFDYDTPDADTLTYTGYCMKCNGVVGCSEERDSCAHFQSYAPMEYSGNTTMIEDEYILSLAGSTERILYRQIYNANTYPLKGLRLYSIIGAIIAMAGILLLLKKSITHVHHETIKRKAMEATMTFEDCMDCGELEQAIEIERRKSQLLQTEASLLIPSFMFESEKSIQQSVSMSKRTMSMRRTMSMQRPTNMQRTISLSTAASMKKTNSAVVTTSASMT